MKSKSTLIISIFCFIPSLAFALLVIDPSIYELEGKLIKMESKTYLAINHGSNSETRFELSGDHVSRLQIGSHAHLKIQVEKKTSSFLGKAKLINIISYLDPFKVVKIYNTEKELKKAVK